jgi:hypothetical protein
LLAGHNGKEASQLARNISRFCSEQRILIEAEFQKSGNDVVDRWGLDLSSSSITSLLRLWAERGREIHLVVDESKPLAAWANAVKNLFPIRPGPQEPGRYLEVEGRRHRLNFALAEPVRFASSKETPGLQLADVMAALVSELLEGRDNRPSDPLFKTAVTKDAIDPSSIFPDMKYIDLTDPRARLNLALLAHMFEASTRGENIADVIPQLAKSAFSESQMKRRP